MSRRDALARLAHSVPGLDGPIGTEIRRRLSEWADPRAKLLRQRRRAARSLAVRSTVAGVSGVSAVVATGPSAVLLEAGFGSVAVIAGVAATAAGVRMRRLRRTPLPPPAPVRPALPPVTSAARTPMTLLAQAQAGLSLCLRQLREGVTTDYVDEIEAGAREAAAALHATSERLMAVEAALANTPPLHRAALTADVRSLCQALTSGVEQFQTLVGEAGRAVAATGHRPAQVESTRRAMLDAADRLRGLSVALGDLRGGG